MADDKKKKQITDEEVTRRMQDMLHGGEPRQFGQPVADGFQAGEVENRSDQDAQRVQDTTPSDESTTPQRYDVDWLLGQYDAMRRDDEAEARRQKNRDMVNGIADMARAIGDLYHTDRYAPSQEVDKILMSDVSRKRYDKAKAERDKRRAEYLNYVQNVSKQRNAEEGYRLRNEQLALREKELALKADKLIMAKDEQEWKHGLEEAKLDLKRQEAEIRQAYYDQKISLEQQRVALQRLSKIRHALDEYEENYEYDPKSGKVVKKWRTVRSTDGDSGTTTTTSDGTTASGNTSTAQQGSGSLLPKSGNSNSTSTQAKGTLLPKKSK